MKRNHDDISINDNRRVSDAGVCNIILLLAASAQFIDIIEPTCRAYFGTANGCPRRPDGRRMRRHLTMAMLSMSSSVGIGIRRFNATDRRCRDARGVMITVMEVDGDEMRNRWRR